jgi:hypothetical protein
MITFKTFNKASALAVVILVGGAGGAQAVDANATFTGLITNTCVLTVGTPGIITANSGFSGLSSDNAGGSESTVSALITGGTFNVSAIAPSTFTLGDSTNVSFATDYSLSGASTASDVAGATTTAISSGVTNVAVDLSATKSSGNFGAGAYAATVIVRCE